MKAILCREWGGPDPLARALLALIGLGTTGLAERHTFADAALLSHAGAFAQRGGPGPDASAEAPRGQSRGRADDRRAA